MRRRAANRGQIRCRWRAALATVGVVAAGLVGSPAHAAGADVTDNGGTITAQYAGGGIGGAENFPNLIDNDPSTKYFLRPTTSAWVQYRSPVPAAVNRYTITSAMDAPDRDPGAWSLEGSTDGRSWTVLDSRRGEVFARRGLTRGFLATSTAEYTYYRLTVTATNGSRELQFAEWELWTGNGQPAAPSMVTAVAVAADTVDVTWRDNSTVDTGCPETGFEVQRSQNGGPFVSVAIVGADVTLFTDSVAGQRALSYRVRAVTDHGPASEFSPVATVTSGPIDDVRLTDLPGTVTDRYNSLGDEGAEQGMDRSPFTKYLVRSTTTWLGYTLEQRAVATGYTLTTANDSPDRDPRTWSLLASQDGVTWTTLDHQVDQVFTGRHQTRSYRLDNHTPYKHYRLEVSANNGAREIQLAELAVFGTAAPVPMPLPSAPGAPRVETLSGDQFLISWQDTTRWETAVRLERSTDGVTWDWARTLPNGTTRYRDYGVPGPATLHYRLRAENATGASAYTDTVLATTGSTDLPETWQEHWHEHAQLVRRVHYTDGVAVYFDAEMEPSQTWLYDYTDSLWRYIRATYDGFGNTRLAAIYHSSKYGGGHPATFLDASHDHRNAIDIGLTNWSETDSQPRDIVTHELAHVVEGAFGGVQGSPSIALWKDSKWAEIFQYDLYRGAGLTADAERWRAKVSKQRDGFPRPDTAWFRDWFAPIYDDYGQTEVLVGYLRLLTEHFHQHNGKYTRDLNWGEFVYFWSGAAGIDLRPLATNAFGWPDEWEQQFQQARVDFPNVRFGTAGWPG